MTTNDYSLFTTSELYVIYILISRSSILFITAKMKDKVGKYRILKENLSDMGKKQLCFI